MTFYNKHVFVCTNKKITDKPCCANTGGEACFEYIKSQLLELDASGPGKIKVSKSGCLGRCALGPCVVIYPEGVWYHYASTADIDEIIQRHLLNNTIAEHLLIDS